MGARNRGGIHSLELTPGIHKRLKIRVLDIHRLVEFIPFIIDSWAPQTFKNTVSGGKPMSGGGGGERISTVAQKLFPVLSPPPPLYPSRVGGGTAAGGGGGG
jgi:hypothetical protein